MRRCPRIGAVERLLSVAYVYPYRCPMCSLRFRSMQWGVRYARLRTDRREYRRVAVRLPLALAGRAGEASGEAQEISLEGCTVVTAARFPRGATVRLTLELEPDGPPLEVDVAVVRSVRPGEVGLQFVTFAAAERSRLRRFVDGLLARQQGVVLLPAAPVPTRRSLVGDFWLVAAMTALLVLGLVMLFPSFTFCTWGVDC